jgi:hypothetical protein
MNITTAFPSEYVSHADLDGRDVALKIKKVEMREVGQGKDKTKKPIVYFQGTKKGLLLNKTNAASIVEITGSKDTDDWKGKTIVLYPTRVPFGADIVDAIRIRIGDEAEKATKAAAAAPEPEADSDVFGDSEVEDDDDEGASDIPF